MRWCYHILVSGIEYEEREEQDYEMILQMKNGESKASQLQETVQEIFDILKKYDVKIGG